MRNESVTMMVVLLVVGLAIGAGVGYFMAPKSDTSGSSVFKLGYDEGFEDFRFGWRYGDELRCAWNQVWFNATSAV